MQKAALHTASIERSKKWPNTIHALRAKKEAAKREKAELEEAERCKVDEQEAAFRAEQRRIQVRERGAIHVSEKNHCLDRLEDGRSGISRRAASDTCAMEIEAFDNSAGKLESIDRWEDRFSGPSTAQDAGVQQRNFDKLPGDFDTGNG